MSFSPLRKYWQSVRPLRRRRKLGWAPSAGSGLELLEDRLALAPLATTTALASTVRNPAAGQPVTFTATVSQSAQGTPTPTGSVEFFDNGKVVSTVALNASEKAVLVLSNLSLGTNTITAKYLGDSNNLPSSSTQLPILNGGSNELFLNQVFLTVFRQPIDPNSLQQLDSQFAIGRPRSNIVATIINSSNAQASGVQITYQTYLDRPAGLGEVSQTLRLAKSTNGGVRAVVLGSPSFFFTKGGGTAAGWVKALEAAVGVKFTSAQAARLTAQASRGASLIKLAAGVLNGPARDQSIQQAFGQLLGRQASAQELAFYGGRPGKPLNYVGMINSILASDEYYYRVTSPLQFATATTLTAAPNPSPAGQSVTLTATVTANATNVGPPTGRVVFVNGTTLVGTATLNSNGVATLTTTTLPNGANSLVAQYQGSSTFAGSISPTFTQNITASATSTTSLKAVPTSSVFGQPITLTATVVGSSSGKGTPSGSVQFFHDAISLGTATLNISGVATLTTANLGLGANSITAKYQGDDTFLTSTSPAVTETVTQASSSTVVSSSKNPAAHGVSVTLSATVTAASPGQGTPTGSVQFFNGATLLGTGALNPSGVATLATTTLPLGDNSITAKYQGDVHFKAGTSPAFTQKITGTTSTLTVINPQPNTAVFGQSVKLTATVTTSGPDKPTGKVKFFTGTTLLGEGTLDTTGITFINTTALPVGTDSVTAQYQGDNTFASSTSSAANVIVTQSSSSTSLSSSANPSTIGQSVTFTATVAAAGAGAGTPSGTVQFLNGTTSLGTATLDSAGKAKFTTSSLPVGVDSITARYQGDKNFVQSVSPALSQRVTGTKTSTTTVSANPTTAVAGQQVTLTATVLAGTGETGKPTGTVQFFAGTVSLGTGTLNSSGIATLVTPSIPIGDTNAITAQFLGDASFKTSTSPSTNVKVTQAASSTALASSPNPSNSGQSVTLTATVTPADPSTFTPSGKVEFFNGPTSLGEATLNGSGVATLGITTLPVGANPLTAVYKGDTSFKTSTSPIVTQTVNP